VNYKNEKRNETKDGKREPLEASEEMKELEEGILNKGVKDKRKRVRQSA
jgi:hypothetical protein